MLDSFKTNMRDAAQRLSEWAESALNETHIRIAITGLSQAGKTVFITSAINNLLALGHGRNTLPKLQDCLKANGANLLKRVSIAPAGATTTPQFDYQKKLDDLASGMPTWPPRTEDLSQIALDLEIDRVDPLAQRLGRRRVRLEFLDYPGEWLLDLPLLSKSYRAWSEETLRLLQRPPRRLSCAPFFEFLVQLDPEGPADEALMQRGHNLYRAALQECRSRSGFRYLQPGRFLCPGPRVDAPFMWFFPLEYPSSHLSLYTLGGRLNERFEKYKDDIREHFFNDHFTHFNRQVVLVDVLSALHAGRETFKDIECAIADIAAQLRYGSNALSALKQAAGAMIERAGVLAGPYAEGAKKAGRALSSPLIERIAFVATKGDHVPAMRRENLKNLLKTLAESAQQEEPLGKVPVTYHTIASVLSTTDGIEKMNGHPVEVVWGLPLGESRQRAFYPGDVPSGRPPDTFWSDRFFELPVFAPPRIDPTGAAGIPHQGIDEVLVTLIKDIL
jgi:predicted YcjX-like family ATPase